MQKFLTRRLEEFTDSGPLTGIHLSLLQEELRMGGKREKPENIVLKLRQVEVLKAQGKPFGSLPWWQCSASGNPK